MPQLPTFNSFSFFCKWEEIMEQLTDHSCSSSIDSSSHSPFFSSVAPSSSSSSSLGVSSNNNNINNCTTKRDLSTDLRLGLSFSSPSTHKDDCSTSTRRDEGFDWPPIRPFLRSTLAEQQRHDEASLFVKVYMEGIPIGRKLDLYAHRDYNELVATLAHMFKTTILCPGSDGVHWTSEKHHVLTYEDKEGDMMMVGDVPWEMFLTTVKRLKITRADRC